jgi:aspartate ammonia-lyase
MAAQRKQPAATRLERDLLGELPVPADALYGIRTVRALRNLSFSGRSLSEYPAYVKALAMVKKAAARANRAAAVLDERVASAIEHACDVLLRGELNLNVFEAVAGVNLFDAVEMLVRAVRLFVECCLTGITANAARCQALAARARTV